MSITFSCCFTTFQVLYYLCEFKKKIRQNPFLNTDNKTDKNLLAIPEGLIMKRI